MSWLGEWVYAGVIALAAVGASYLLFGEYISAAVIALLVVIAAILKKTLGHK